MRLALGRANCAAWGGMRRCAAAAAAALGRLIKGGMGGRPGQGGPCLDGGVEGLVGGGKDWGTGMEGGSGGWVGA